MLRPFLADDIPNYPEIKIYTHTRPDNSQKDYLYIERKSFISCVVIIDNIFGIFVEQFRPVIQATTLEVPMGKIESFDANIEEALKRELKEECNLMISQNVSLTVQHPHHKQTKSIIFQSHELHADRINYLSPGFSTAKQYPFVLKLTTLSQDFLQELGEYQLFSQENNLNLHCIDINQVQLDGISRYLIMPYQTFLC